MLLYNWMDLDAENIKKKKNVDICLQQQLTIK